MKKFLAITICFIMFFIFVSCDSSEINKYQEEQYQIYMLAKEAGFTGTYEEWLASIKGDKGDQGDKGETGKSAYQTFIEYYPEYTGTEEEWITAVAKGDICKLFGHVWEKGEISKPTDTDYAEQKYICSQCQEEKKEIITDFEPDEIEIIGEEAIYVGYTMQLTCKAIPSKASNSVIWTSSNPEMVSVDENGLVTALKSGTVRIKATSKFNENVEDTIKITILEGNHLGYPNMGGYEIVIMTPKVLLNNYDPFLDDYIYDDKEYKQIAWREVESNYNCKISVKEYTQTVPWDNNRISWIISNANNNSSECDLVGVAASWIPKLVQNDAAVDIKNYYGLYGKKSMEPTLLQAGSYKGKLYAASYGIRPLAIYPDLGLFYNVGWLEELGVKDPAQMFNDGEWTYSGFTSWVKETQSKLDDGKFVFGGHPYNYYYGMTNAAGVKISDHILVQINYASSKSKAACELIYNLVDEGCCDKNVSWAEADGGFVEGTTLMTTGYLSFANNDVRWKEDMFGEDTRYGYVPFPYPDDYKKEDTKVRISEPFVLMYVAGRKYSSNVTLEYIYRAINEMYLNTNEYLLNDSEFDVIESKKNSLRKLISNEASLDAIIYYDVSKAFYDSIETYHPEINISDLQKAAINVMYNGASFEDEFDLTEDEDIIYR